MIRDCRKSLINEQEADSYLKNVLEGLTTAKSSPLAGNSIVYDRLFMMKYFPETYSHLHFQSIDVSTISLLARLVFCLKRQWASRIENFRPKKSNTHRFLWYDFRTMQDIQDSIEQLKHYRDYIFR